MSTTEQLDALYQQRFPGEDRRQKDAIWKVLCQDYFQRFVAPGATVVDIGAGYCEFINHIVAARKIAVDANPDSARYAAPDVEMIHASCDAIDQIPSGSADVVFMSNFLEHLPDKAAVLAVMRESFRILRPGGRVIVLQPNIRYVPGEYWDFFDHHTPLTDRSLVEGLHMAGFRPQLVVPRFLPYTTKSRLPKAPLLVRLYLRMPVLWRLFGAQALVVATKDGDEAPVEAPVAPAPSGGLMSRRLPLPLLLALGVLAFLLIFALGSPPTAPGLDPAWTEVLGWGFLHQAQWGRDLIFTYGPLGFLQPYASHVDGIFRWYAAGQIALPAAFALALCLLLRRAPLALVLGFAATYLVVCAQLAGDIAWALTLIFGSVWLVRAGRERLSVGWVAAATIFAFAFAAVAFTKFTLFPLWVVCIGAIVALQFAAGRHRAAFLLAVGFVAALLLVWAGAGQKLANLPAFVSTSLQLARGYPHAMGDRAPLLHEALGLFVNGLFLLGCAFAAWSQRGDRSRLTLTAICALAGLLFWLACFVRGDHWAGYYPSIALLPFALLTDPALRSARVARVLLVAVVALAALAQKPQPAMLGTAAFRVRNAIYNLGHLGQLEATRAEQWRTAGARVALPKIRAQVGNERVDMLTWEQGMLLLNSLSYAPRPVFQSYAAFTPELARRNEAYFLDPKAPRYVLFKLDFIDGRVPTLEDGLALVALLRQYRPVLSERGFLLLQRDAAAGAVQPVREDGKADAAELGGELPVPTAGKPTLAFIHVELNAFGKLYTLLFREPELYLTRHTTDGRAIRQRLVRPTAASGFLISPVVESNADWVKLYGSRPLRGVDRIAVDAQSPWERMAFGAGYRVSWQTFEPLRAGAANANALLGMTMLYPGFNLAPTSESNEYRTVIEDGQDSLFLHASATLEFQPQPGRYRIGAIAGLQHSAVIDGGCRGLGADGIGVSLLLQRGNSETTLLHRDLNPFLRPADGGAQRFQVEGVEIADGDRVLYRVDPGPTGGNVACDWSYVRDLTFNRQAAPTSYPGFNVASTSHGFRVVDEDGKPAVFMPAPTALTLLPADGRYRVSATYGVRREMVDDPSCKRLGADGITLALVLRHAGSDTVLWHGQLDPFHRPADAGAHTMTLDAVDVAVGDSLEWRVGTGPPGSKPDCDWSYLRDLRLDPIRGGAGKAGDGR